MNPEIAASARNFLARGFRVARSSGMTEPRNGLNFRNEIPQFGSSDGLAVEVARPYFAVRVSASDERLAELCGETLTWEFPGAYRVALLRYDGPGQVRSGKLSGTLVRIVTDDALLIPGSGLHAEFRDVVRGQWSSSPDTPILNASDALRERLQMSGLIDRSLF